MTTAVFTSDGLARLHDDMQGYVDRGDVAGIVTGLQREGETVIDAVGVQDFATGVPMAENTIFRIASMTKPVMAVAAMQLIDDGVVAMDDPIATWIPELANPRVLRAIDAELDDTVPVKRPLVVRDLMRFTLGYGVVMTGQYPVTIAMQERDVAPGGFPSRHPTDTWIATLASLPLFHQPGEDWLYHTGSDVLGVLVERLTGQSLETRFHERIFGPLGMVDTGFSVPPDKQDRFATAYRIGEANTLVKIDDPRTGAWSSPPPFLSGGGGLVSTVPDFLRFAQMLLNGGELDGVRIVSEAAVRDMTIDQITAAEKNAWPGYRVFQGTNGWGYGVSVVTGPDEMGHDPGTYGWMGGLGTAWDNNPRRKLAGVVLTQRELRGPHDVEIPTAFWKRAYTALAD